MLMLTLNSHIIVYNAGLMLLLLQERSHKCTYLLVGYNILPDMSDVMKTCLGTFMRCQPQAGWFPDKVPSMKPVTPAKQAQV